MDKDKKPSKLGDILKKLTPKVIKDIAQKEKDSSYDIRKIFEELELNLISSMKKAFYFHQAEQTKEGFQWEQWQLTKLREIEKYRRSNKKLIEKYNKPIQEAINRELRENYLKGQNRVSRLIDKIKQILQRKKDPVISLLSDIEETQGIKEYIAKMMNRPIKPPPDENFFGINDKKLEALQQSVTNDMNNANQAVLRKMDDVYRQILFKSHVFMQSGAKTLNQAIDMATKDFLDKGINCIEYKDGKRVNIASYAEMALRTASQRATFLGEGKKMDEWGIHLVVVSAHANTCDKCLPWQGKVLIDDVFSHPSNEYITENIKQYRLLSEAMKAGLLHPNCRHTLTTYFPGITKLPTIPNEDIARKNYAAEQEQRYIERQIRRWKRVLAGSCDVENIKKANDKLKYWEDKLKKNLKENLQLRRDYGREEPGPGVSIKDIKANTELLKQKALSDKIEETRNYIKSDKCPKEILEGKQGKHILRHNNYTEGRSYLTISLEEAQELVNRYAGTGDIRFTRKGEWDKKEIIKFNKMIGININQDTGEQTPTSSFKIHYSDNGTHIVPTIKED